MSPLRNGLSVPLGTPNWDGPVRRLRPAAVFGAVGGMEAVRLQGEPRPRPRWW